MFDYNEVESVFPGAGNLMINPMKIWAIPADRDVNVSDLEATGEYFAQEKIDGAIYTLAKTKEGKCYLFGRVNSVNTGLLTEKSQNVPHIIDAFKAIPPETVIVGEIFYPGKTSRDVTAIMGCKPEKAVTRQEDKYGKIHYYIHDIIYYNGESLLNTPALDRYQILCELWQMNKSIFEENGFIHLAKIYTSDFQKRLTEIWDKGGEGLVLKKKTSLYVPGKRPAWETIKVKKHDTVDLICVGFCNPTIVYAGKGIENWQYWEMRSEENKSLWTKVEGDMYEKYKEHKDLYRPVTKDYFFGWKNAIEIGGYDNHKKLVKVGTVSSGFTDEDKKNMAEHPEMFLNKVVELGCMSKSMKDRTLRHPVFIRVRDDKNPSECKLSYAFRPRKRK